jgi:hypothetical protein
LSARLRDTFQLPVWADVFSPFSRNIAVALALFSLMGLIDVTPSLTTPLCATLLAAPHRHRHDQNHKHDRGRHHDHDDAGANREHDKRGAHAFLSSTVAPAYVHDRQVAVVVHRDPACDRAVNREGLASAFHAWRV